MKTPLSPFRSREWFAAPDRSDMAALYLERFMNYGITPDELRCGKPIIGIAQSGSDLTPCNRIRVELAHRVRAGIRDSGGIPMKFPPTPSSRIAARPPRPPGTTTTPSLRAKRSNPVQRSDPGLLRRFAPRNDWLS